MAKLEQPLFELSDATSINKEDISKKVDATKGKRVQGGFASTDLIMSSYIGRNSKVFADILSLHVPHGCRIADVTYGKGVFWQEVPTGVYKLTFSDIDAKSDLDNMHNVSIQDKIDSRSLPYSDSSFEAIIFDPPYQEGLLRSNQDHMAGNGTHDSFRQSYSNGKPPERFSGIIEAFQNFATDKKRVVFDVSSKWHDAVLSLYAHSALEARRVLVDKGIYIIKCQDEVSANKQRLTHVELITLFESMGFYCKDLFVLTRDNRPNVSNIISQVHARKNHSYFLVFQKVSRQQVVNTITLRQ